MNSRIGITYYMPGYDANSTVPGWTCGECGAFVPNGVYHSHYYTPYVPEPTSGTPFFQSTPLLGIIDSDSLKRIADALERIADKLEKEE